MAIDTEDDIVQDFLVESREILDALQEQLVDLEQRPDDRELLNAVFRGFHTIKGGAGFLNLEALVDVCHRTEDLFNLLRTGEKTVTSELMDVVLQALDVVQSQFADLDAGRELKPAPAKLLAALETLSLGASEAAMIAAAEGRPLPEAAAVAGDAAADGDITEQEFEALLDAIADGKSAAPAASPQAAKAAAAEPAAALPADEITDDEFEKLLDNLHGAGKHGGVPQNATPAEPAAPKAADLIGDDEFEKLLDSLHGSGRGPTSVAQAKAAPPKPAAAKPVTPKPAARAEPAKTAAAKAEPPTLAADDLEQEQERGRAKAETTVRVDTAKLDDIMNMVGELVLVRNRLSTLRGLLNDERINQAVSDLELVTSDLQTAVMKTRMQPIKKVFGRFPRLVRDLARGLKKEIELELRGEDTDLDKNLVEALADPLIHLVRNAVDHGIEEPADRQMAGKARAGRVILSAEQEGDHILLSIADDGRGMDPEHLRRKVVEKGLIDAESAARLEPEDCFNLIFLPGFSTKSEISDISGRGVGMDVVKTRIAQLNGSIEINSKLGVGTTMKIKVPLTLAILPTLMVKVNERKFALPMSVVREIFELDPTHTNVVDGRLTVMVRKKAMPLFFMDRWLKGLSAPPIKNRKLADGGGDRQVVTVVIGNQAIGFVVDEVIGLEEVVIKPLGALLHGLPGLAGSTITGDGKIALIVDIPSLIKSFGSRL